MKLLDEIIASLASGAEGLPDALMKTKVLLHSIGRKDLAAWVTSELNGYSDMEDVPNYRVVNAQLKGDVTNGYFIHNSHPLPVRHLKAEFRDGWQHPKLRQSIAVIEELARKTDKSLTSPLPLEANHLFDKVLTDGYYVQRAWAEFDSPQLRQVTTQVRSRLLDFLLDLKTRAGDQANEEEVKRVGQQPATASMFNNAIFGNNATILVGDGNVQRVTNRIRGGDFNSLADVLRQHRVPERDIDDLREAIHADGAAAAELQAGTFGSAVQRWLKKMLSKAVDASWQIELGVASNLLTEALRAYYS